MFGHTSPPMLNAQACTLERTLQPQQTLLEQHDKWPSLFITQSRLVKSLMPEVILMVEEGAQCHWEATTCLCWVIPSQLGATLPLVTYFLGGLDLGFQSEKWQVNLHHLLINSQQNLYWNSGLQAGIFITCLHTLQMILTTVREHEKQPQSTNNF